eukprot:1570876-Prymnesium_polylepis.1
MAQRRGAARCAARRPRVLLDMCTIVSVAASPLSLSAQPMAHTHTLSSVSVAASCEVRTRVQSTSIRNARGYCVYICGCPIWDLLCVSAP